MPNEKTGVMRLHTLAVIAASVILIGVAFLAGLLVAMRGAERLPTTGEDPNDEYAQNAIDNDDEDGDIAVTWYDADARPEREPNFYVRAWWESQYGVNENASFSARVMGEVADGTQLVQEAIITGMDLGDNTVYLYVLEQQKSDINPVVLTTYAVSTSWSAFLDPASADMFATDAAGVTWSDDTIVGMEFPDMLSSEDGTAEYTRIGLGHPVNASMFATNNPYTKYTTASGVVLYEFDAAVMPTGSEYVLGSGVNHEFFAVRPDGRTVWYTITMTGWTTSTEQRVQTPRIAWNDGSAVAEYTRGMVSGCGFQALTNVVTEVPALVAAGEAIDNGSVIVYVPADYADPLLADAYTNWKNYAVNVGGDTADVSVAAFAATHPVFYMYDPVGRLVQFMRTEIAPPGECGKPVIYLYPTTTTNIDVSLAPQGGFTKSEPAYGNGWHVTAQPDGTLTNLADGKTYPYLFWEGRGGLYSAPQKYWVVARADVPSFLTSTLAKLGLNAKESADFMEFWLPRMTAAPYYKIGFHGTNVMNAIAPMTLSQKADTLLRVLMDYSELSSPIPSNPPTLGKTPARNGFTVIEWGGVIR